ncbi:MAG: hypothetical protein SOW25_07225, partial [Helicobacter sp.]|nr:hypothetical protein [Helicobacter sp.]
PQAPLGKQTPLEILYLPHKNTPQNYNKIIINSIKQYKLKQIDKIQDCNALITDNQNLALEFITNFKKPCIFALSGLVDGIFKLNELAPEHLQQLIYYAYSLEELTNAIKQIKQK